MLVHSYSQTIWVEIKVLSQFFENNIEFLNCNLSRHLFVRTRRVSLAYMSASANQFRDGSAANSANLPFFSELSCFWAWRASQDTKKGSLTLIAPQHITDNWYGRKNVVESKERDQREVSLLIRNIVTPESSRFRLLSSSSSYNL